jgi:hypothetical protein
MELGIAFENLPEGRYFPCLIYKSGELDCKLEYIEGPPGKGAVSAVIFTVFSLSLYDMSA